MIKKPDLKLRHVGIFVTDIDVMSSFYIEVLGFTQTDRGSVRGGEAVFLTKDPASHHQLVMETGRPKGTGPGLGIQQISFLVNSLDDLRSMHGLVSQRSDVQLIQTVDHGNSWSLYFRDPEFNRIEIYLDTPWHIPQPYLEPLDLSTTDAEIHNATREKLLKFGTLQSMESWSQDLSLRINF
jgi:catechol-2,3-dioxygenase